MSTPRPNAVASGPRSMSLPVELWLAIVQHLLDQSDDQGQWRNVARLSWTCRNAYAAAHRPLWRHLCLVFRTHPLSPIHSEDCPSLLDKFRRLLPSQWHEQVCESSVFPRYRTGQLTEINTRLARIRQASIGYPHLQPFVVRNGRLYLASLVENERHPESPNLSGLASLWEDASVVEKGVLVIDGLVLVPFPLHLVNEVSIDTLAAVGGIQCSNPRNALSFLFDGIDSNRVRALRFFPASNRQQAGLSVTTLGRLFTNAVIHDYRLCAGLASSPSLGQSTRAVRVFSVESAEYIDVEKLCRDISMLPAIDSLELLGVFEFGIAGDILLLFSSTTLTRLVLDFHVSWSFYRGSERYDPFLMYMPSLRELTLAMIVAQMLFDDEIEGGMFLSSSSRPAIFPALTHLTLVDRSWPNESPSSDIDDKPEWHLPWVPFNVMPSLTHFLVLHGHRVVVGCGFTMHCSDLHSLFRNMGIHSFVAPGLDVIGNEGQSHYAFPLIAPRLTHVDLNVNGAKRFFNLVHASSLVSMRVNLGDECVPTRLLSGAPKMTRLHLDTRGFMSQEWATLAQHLPSLQELCIVDWGNAPQVDVETLPHDPVLRFLHLKALAFATTADTLTFTFLRVPILERLTVVLQLPRSQHMIDPRLETLNVTSAPCLEHDGHVLGLQIPAQCRVKLITSPKLSWNFGRHVSNNASPFFW